jgi:hypothetical protein
MEPQMRVPFPHERLEQRWWRAWWAEDFSWPALARKPLGQRAEGIWSALFKKKALQDYWRLDGAGNTRTDTQLEREGELVRDPNGRLWHLAHVPLHWPNGTAAKATWNQSQRQHLANVVADRLARTEESKFGFPSEPYGADGRAQLQGAILLDPPSLAHTGGSPLRIRCNLAWFPPWDATGETFGPGCGFERALFTGHTRLHRAKFLGGISFERAWFLDELTCGTVSEGAAGFPEFATFRNAIFLGTVHLDRCRFDELRCDYAHFAGRVECFAAHFKHGTFDRAIFDAPSTFMSSTVTECLGFGDIRARRLMEFSSMDLSQARLWFPNAIFESVRMTGTKLPRSMDKQIDGFNGTHFRGAADFSLSGRHWIAALDGATIEGSLTLDKAAPAVLEREFDTKLLPAALKVSRSDGAPEQRMEEQLLKLEGGCRAIRRAAAKAGDSETEQLHARFEAKVREHLRQIPAATAAPSSYPDDG